MEMDLGTKIKNIRYNHNISQYEMAKILEINRNYLSRIETNKSLPTSEILIKVARSFNVSIDSLLGINGEGKDAEIQKKNKIKKINQLCSCLNNKDLDFVINMLNVMANYPKM